MMVLEFALTPLNFSLTHHRVSNAASMAKLAALIANGGELNGVRLFKNKDTITRMLSEPVRKHDGYISINTCFTKGGWDCPSSDWWHPVPLGYGKHKPL